MTTESPFLVKEWIEFLSGEIYNLNTKTNTMKRDVVMGITLILSMVALSIDITKINPPPSGLITSVVYAIIFLTIVYIFLGFWSFIRESELTNFRNAIINGCRYDTPEKIRDEWNRIK